MILAGILHALEIFAKHNDLSNARITIEIEAGNDRQQGHTLHSQIYNFIAKWKTPSQLRGLKSDFEKDKVYFEFPMFPTEKEFAQKQKSKQTEIKFR